MKIVDTLSPKRLFRKKKDRVSRSDPSSFSSGSSSYSSSESSNHHHRKPTSPPDSSGTPTSVLHLRSGDWSDISPEISADIQSDQLLQAFKSLERDSNGLVSRTELEAVLIRLGGPPPTHEEISVMLGDVDRNGVDGCVNLEALMSQLVGSVREPDLRETFDFFDKDQDGKITAEELLSVFKNLGDVGCTLEDCRRMIGFVGKSENGFVCFEDFSKMMELQW